MIKDNHAHAAKYATETVIPQWSAAFKQLLDRRIVHSVMLSSIFQVRQYCRRSGTALNADVCLDTFGDTDSFPQDPHC